MRCASQFISEYEILPYPECFMVFQLADVLGEYLSVIVIKEHFSLVEACDVLQWPCCVR